MHTKEKIQSNIETLQTRYGEATNPLHAAVSRFLIHMDTSDDAHLYSSTKLRYTACRYITPDVNRLLESLSEQNSTNIHTRIRQINNGEHLTAKPITLTLKNI